MGIGDWAILSVLFLILIFVRMLPVEDRVYDQERGADADGAVRDVERRIGPHILIVHQDEVDDIGVDRAVDEVSDRPAEHQGKRRADEAPVRRGLPEHRKDDEAHDDGHAAEEDLLPARLVREEAERRPVVVDVYEPQHVRGPERNVLVTVGDEAHHEEL